MESMELKEICGICNEDKDKGIHLYNLFICSDCEQKIVQTEPKEEKYKHYVNKLKRVNQPTLYS
ncbi:sigma factor G inhibitor Gin [Aquibacillus albus]|uniref:Sigma factor G inhibitor Gin n=1 Tax=Aquibacillus albus TaxID=1168171 RepID=A0ABS2N4V5_9BACI|nr:sigma factor G inhibitor Gin [Aquibacillus albus]MBM7573124.1 hypothetical protein [Aquibacillus albus]